MPPLKGGISQHTSQLAAALASAGTTVTKISWKSQYPRRLYGREQYDTDAAPEPDTEWLLRWWNPVSWFRAGLIARRADIVIMPWVTPVHALCQLLILVLARRSLRVVHVHNVLPHERLPFERILARATLSRADLLTVHAASLQSELRELDIAPTVAVVAMPPLLEATPTPVPSAPPYRLLFIGMIRQYKGLDIAIAAADLLRRQGVPVELTVAGEVWEEACIPSPAEMAALEVPLETHYGYVSDERLLAMLEEHHVLVAPYRSATQSAVVSLALTTGRAVVATDVGGLGEIVREGVNGAIAAPDDIEAFAEAIRRVLSDVDGLGLGAAQSCGTWNDYVEVLESQLSAVSRS